MCAVHHRPLDQRSLVTATCQASLAPLVDYDPLALPDPWPRFEPPRPVTAALGALEARLPPLLRQMLCTSVVVGEVRCELLQRRRPILGPSCRKQACAHPARIIELGGHVMRERYLGLIDRKSTRLNSSQQCAYHM